MPILDIVLYPDPILKQPADEVEKVDAALRKLLEDMAQTMYAAEGIGLAGPQVGVSKRIAVIDVSEDGKGLMSLINPEIVERAGKTPSEEGCLSIPGFRETITRNETVTVRALNEKGEQIEIKADGLLAICLQHEIDHLDGVLFVDHLSRLKREFFKRWLKKQAESE